MTDASIPTNILNRQRRRILDNIERGFARPACILPDGGRFYIVSATGARQLVPTPHIDVIIVDANQHRSRILWSDASDAGPGSGAMPLCFSDNGTGPSTRVSKPQAPACAGCPNNVMGSAMTFNGFKTTKCSRRQKLAVILPDGDTTVYLLDLSPQNIGVFDAYAADFDKIKIPGMNRSLDVADVVTRISWDTDSDTKFKLKFEREAWADDEKTVNLIEYIDTNHLADAIVGRTDTAINADDFKKLPAPEARQPLPAPQAAPIPGQILKRGPGRPPKNPTPPPFIAPAMPMPSFAQQPEPPIGKLDNATKPTTMKFGMADPPAPPQALLDQIMALKTRG